MHDRASTRLIIVRAVPTSIPEVLVIEPVVHGDSRGFFMETFNSRAFESIVGRPVHFVQDNHSRSVKGVLRGLHYQIRQPQGKLVRVTQGEVFDVCVDLRRSSPFFGQWTGVRLSAENRRMVWIPEGFAHGFLVLSESADFQYKTTDFYAPQHERCILWNDPKLSIEWPLQNQPALAAKDKAGLSLGDAEVFD